MNADDHPDVGTPLDHSVLAALREALEDDELLTEVIQNFLDETPAHLATLRAATAAGDDAAAAAAAHLIKGSALTLGAVRLGRTSAAAEASPSAPVADEAAAEFNDAARHLAQFVASLAERP